MFLPRYCYYVAPLFIMKITEAIIHKIKNYKQLYFEIGVWTIALILLFFMQADDTVPSICMLKWLGFKHCPGCGLGHSMHYALHLQLAASFNRHPLGIAAIFIIVHRIKQLSFNT